MMMPTLRSKSGSLLGLLYHSYVPKIINAAIDVNLFETLSSDKISLSELSEKLETNEVVTEALLDVLIALDLVVGHCGFYALTQVAKDFILKSSDANQLAAVRSFSGSVGYFSFAFMQKNQKLKSHVYDLPEVCALGRELKAREKDYDRITYQGFLRQRF